MRSTPPARRRAPPAYAASTQYCRPCEGETRLTLAVGQLPATGRHVFGHMMCMRCADALELPDELVHVAAARFTATGRATVLTGLVGVAPADLSMVEVPSGGNVSETVLADLARYRAGVTARAWLLTDGVVEFAWAPIDDLRQQVHHGWPDTLSGYALPVGVGSSST